MKFYLSLLLLVSILNVKAQKHFEGSVTYNFDVKYLSKADSLYTDSLIKERGFIFRTFFLPPTQSVHIIKKDTVMVQDYFDDHTSPHTVYITSKNEYKTLDMNSGKLRDRKEYTKSKYRNIKKYIRIRNEDEVICGYNCKAWKIKSKNGWNKVWLAETDQVLPSTVKAGISLDNKLILKQIRHYNGKKEEVKYAVEMDGLPAYDFSGFVATNTGTNIKEKYEPIAQNNTIEDMPVKVGQKVPNVYFRQVFKNELANLYQTTAQSNYTMIEFWGSWCLPCLAATPKIKKLRDKFTKQELSIISLNTRDKMEEKVKNLITKKEMNWQHAYSTKKIVSIFNKQGKYPTAVLIDKNNMVVLIGNPHLILEEVERIVGGELSSTKN
ncbi:TlpA disulfide reductase family protein [Marinifilum caeruleilacunae]|uniref:TlpA family protein disulfide reductase n=1 Tax=Marinifilum caeruleilacunae TaxID=2499076 RepID=A0ABX1X0F5_9BACT|nr:TlpA disulfide reductase family protein [Marinifilum caeruleilacunae]NOU61886.1 TlpA family protein disulfide reductase [Marinifilum caeruleilacunae]